MQVESLQMEPEPEPSELLLPPEPKQADALFIKRDAARTDPAIAAAGDVASMMKPVGDRAEFSLQRKDKGCISFHAQDGSFLACARLLGTAKLTKGGRWIFYSSSEAMALSADTLVRAGQSQHGLFGELTWGSMVPTVQKLTLHSVDPGGNKSMVNVSPRRLHRCSHTYRCVRGRCR